MAATIRFSPKEDEILEAYCRQHQRTKNDVVRELVRSLKQQPQSIDLEPLMLTTGATEARLVTVAPETHELYLDGHFLFCGSYDEIRGYLANGLQSE